jgi:hypothetical protein
MNKKVKLPQAKILLGCWMANGDTSTVIKTVKADAIADTLREATKLCLEAAREVDYETLPLPAELE